MKLSLIFYLFLSVIIVGCGGSEESDKGATQTNTSSSTGNQLVWGEGSWGENNYSKSK